MHPVSCFDPGVEGLWDVFAICAFGSTHLNHGADLWKIAATTTTVLHAMCIRSGYKCVRVCVFWQREWDRGLHEKILNTV